MNYHRLFIKLIVRNIPVNLLLLLEYWKHLRNVDHVETFSPVRFEFDNLFLCNLQ